MTTPRVNFEQNERGALTRLTFNDDPTGMNWVVAPDYLDQVGYRDQDKLFGEFQLVVNGTPYQSTDYQPELVTDDNTSTVNYRLPLVDLREDYDASGQELRWGIKLKNTSRQSISIDHLGIWLSLAYIMYRDADVRRNAEQSAAVFPTISPSFTKLAAVRRKSGLPNLGCYQLTGTVRSVGTFAEYTNRFFENVSPSLDGLLFHQLVLAGGYPHGQAPHNDWIYSRAGLRLAAGEEREWQFAFAEFADQAGFYRLARHRFGHPQITFAPLVDSGQDQVVTIDSPQAVKRVWLISGPADRLTTEEVTEQLTGGRLTVSARQPGEHQLQFEFTDGSTDMVVFNVMDSISKLLERRTNYLCQHSYSGPGGRVPDSFAPLSNQGESLGKLNFILQECLLNQQQSDRVDAIRKVEASAVNYVRPKWFVDGDFLRPRKLYGDFYRVMDLEYIAHLFYLLSQCADEELEINPASTYLKWAAQVFDVRVNPDLHDNQRGKEEAQMLGVYYMYINDLLADLKRAGLTKEYSEISQSWQAAINRVADQSSTLKAAVTEHFFDNAGFGPATGALAVNGDNVAVRRYARLLKANIGFSNDFRSQAPDRWWEALSYMMHSLWGGITAAAAQIAGEHLGDPELVAAGYRATVAMLYLYDSNATATDRILKPGEAASTYSISGPNINRPDLSRNRFGQSIFASNGGIFARLFPDGYTGEDDWDMGEELVAYLNGFGQKTYLYRDDTGRWRAINGRVTDDGEVVTMAPYIREYVDLTNHRVIKTTERKIKLEEL